MLLEVCIDSVEGARAAAEAGAARVELCAGLPAGGTTPSHGLTKQVRSVLASSATRLMVLIRCRAGDFVYSEDEVQVMLEDIQACAQLGADGVVVGCLSPDGRVDKQTTAKLLSTAKAHGLDVTFHRAFDVSRDLSEALEDIISLGIPRVLTSGGCPTAEQGAAVIAQLVRQAAGRPITILAGGGVRSGNAAELIAKTGVQELHSAARKLHTSDMGFRRPDLPLCSQTPLNDFEWSVTDKSEVRRLQLACSSVAHS